MRVTRDPYELFVQFQDSTIANVPDNGVGVGAVYYANTHAALQNGAILRNAWVGTRRILDQPISGRAGRLLYSDGLDVQADVESADIRGNQPQPHAVLHPQTRHGRRALMPVRQPSRRQTEALDDRSVPRELSMVPRRHWRNYPSAWMDANDNSRYGRDGQRR